MEKMTACPRCDGGRLLQGSFVYQGQRTAPLFRPPDMPVFTLWKSPMFSVDPDAAVCVDCGLVMGEADPQKVRAVLDAFATDQQKRDLSLE